MGLMDSIFGNSGGVSGKAKRAGWDVWGQYGNMANGNWYNPQVDQSMAMNQFDRQRGLGQAAGYGKIAGGGYRPSGGVDYMALARAMYGSGVGQKARQQALDWRYRGLQGQSGLLPTIIGANTTAPSGGLLGGLASLGGSGGISSVAKLFGIG